MRWKIIGRPHTQKYSMQHKVFYCANIKFKKNAKVICSFDRFRKAKLFAVKPQCYEMSS